MTGPSLLRAVRNLLIAAVVLIGLPCALVQSQNSPSPMPDFAMSAQQEAFRSVADDFIAAAAAGDMVRAGRMLSPAIAAKSGRDAVANFLAGEVRPFFARFTGLAGSVSVTRTADVPGFVFYMHMVTRADELRPFVIYVIEEGGAKVVANVLVDRFVEGRHCARVDRGWKCPDFG